MTTPRYTLRQTVQVILPDGTYLGVIDAMEPGASLREPIDGTAYHVRLAGHDGLEPRVVVVGEGALRGLTEDEP